MKLSSKERAKNILIMVFSNFLFAVSVTGFIRPHGIILGGATGLGLLITHYVNMKLSVVVMIINVVLLLIAYITMGKKFALSTLANSILYPAMMYVFETFITLGKVTEDPMLSCVFGGVLMGIGIGMILKTGGSTGGTDVIAVAINKYTHVNLSALLYLVDGVIMACQLINDLENNKRGIYGGAIGYLSFTGNLDTCIAIRIAYKKNGKVFVRSGAGIVADSVPEKEYQECINKAAAVVKSLELAKEVDL